MKKILILLIFFSIKTFSQEIVEIRDVYVENNLIYKNSNEKLFTGIIQKKRRNGHLVFEEKYKNGIILEGNLYFNGKEKRISEKKIYHSEKPQTISKEIKYYLNGEIFQIKTYNNSGFKVLLEQFKNGKRIYSCEYLGKKKNGIELGYRENGTLFHRCEYKNGKKNGKEFCINEKGEKTTWEYKNGKKVK